MRISLLFRTQTELSSLYLFSRAEHETQSRLEKATDIKEIDDRIVSLKREISQTKDNLIEYTTFETFLYTLSPESWRIQQEQEQQQQQQLEEAEATNTGNNSKDCLLYTSDAADE